MILPEGLLLRPLCHYSPLFFSSPATAASAPLDPSRLMCACSYHRIPTRAPSALSNPAHRSSSNCVAMYYVTMLFRCRMYSSIVCNPASSLAAATKFYYRFPSVFCCGSSSVIRRATWSWNPPRSLPIQGVTVQVSEPKIDTACTMALKKIQTPAALPPSY